MELEKIKEILSTVDIDINTINENLEKVNLKSILSSLDFIKVIMRIEEANHLEFSENQLKENVVTFEIINKWIKNAKA